MYSDLKSDPAALFSCEILLPGKFTYYCLTQAALGKAARVMV